MIFAPHEEDANAFRLVGTQSPAFGTGSTYTSARAHLAALCDDVAATRDAIIIRRRGAEPVALVAADEIDSLMETAHLLRSPKNAERLLKAIVRAKGRTLRPRSIASLRRELGLDERN